MKYNSLEPFTLPPFPFDLTGVFTAIISFLRDPAAAFNAIMQTNAFFYFQFFLFFIAALFIIGITVVLVKTNAIQAKTRSAQKKKITAEEAVRFEDARSKRLEVIRKHMESDNPAEWKLAIIEADTLLETIVKKMGYEGATIGDMMKKIEISDMNTLNDAWEAHKIRNFIAHQGSTFELTKRDAKRVIRLYENVFREFGIV